MKLFAIFTLLIFLTSCADTHQWTRNNILSTAKLTQSDSFFISISKDGIYGTKTYRGSGQNTAQIISSAFTRHARSIKIANTFQNFKEALAATQKARKKYLIFSTILHWEDRATEWSGISDKVEVKIEIVDATSGNSIAIGIIKGKSGLATLGGDHPQDLLPKPIKNFVSSLY